MKALAICSYRFLFEMTSIPTRIPLQFISSTNIFNLHILSIPRPKITPQRPSKQLLQHLKANPTQSRIVPPLTQLIPDKRMLRPRWLVKRKRNARLMQRLADQIASLGRHVIVHLAKDHDELAFDVFGALDGVVGFAGAKGAAVDIGGEVADGGGDAGVQSAAVGQVAA
jgi:hypothetical protein